MEKVTIYELWQLFCDLCYPWKIISDNSASIKSRDSVQPFFIFKIKHIFFFVILFP